MERTKKMQTTKYKIAMFGVLALFFLSLGLLNSPAYSSPISPTVDTFVNDSATSDSYGTSTDLYVGRLKVLTFNSLYRSFLKFDLSSIPDGSTVTSAELKLYCKNPVGSQNYEAHHVASDSSITDSMTWSSQPSVGLTFLDTQYISPSDTGWISWNLLSSSNWNYAGDLTDDFFSVRLIRSNETTNVNIYAVFHSMENTSGDTYDPFLEIGYMAVPVPASILLLLSGLAGIAWIRKRLERYHFRDI